MDVNGEVIVSIVDIDKGFSDGCNILDFLLDIIFFDCENVGDNIVVLIVINFSGDFDDCYVFVLVLDNIVFVFLC